MEDLRAPDLGRMVEVGRVRVRYLVACRGARKRCCQADATFFVSVCALIVLVDWGVAWRGQTGSRHVKGDEPRRNMWPIRVRKEWKKRTWWGSAGRSLRRILVGVRYAPIVESACEVEVVYLPLVWYGRLLTALNTWGRSEPVDVGSRERMAREGPRAMVLPKRNGATPTVCNAMGNSSR